ncbi:MAG TPA: hypothetical protein VIM87_14815 [Chitinophaga sp.]|uniref:hypothetical protein n=1 Tax=Chitinophaga sp. TaxID=1869181 RepID=UPI002F92692C
MKEQEMNLNIRYDAPDEVWDKVPVIYAQLNGWLGYGLGGDHGEKGIPYWFSFNEDEKHISASVEPGGLQFVGLMDTEEWDIWVKAIKEIATKELGYKVGEIELGEVDF